MGLSMQRSPLTPPYPYYSPIAPRSFRGHRLQEEVFRQLRLVLRHNQDARLTCAGLVRLPDTLLLRAICLGPWTEQVQRFSCRRIALLPLIWLIIWFMNGLDASKVREMSREMSMRLLPS